MYPPDDLDVLEYLDDDGMKIEPKYYVPIIPMILVNGAIGIGTGFSTNIPCYNQKDIINNLKRLMRNEEIVQMTPWYRGFKGTNTDGVSKGLFKRVGTTNKIEVTELPIGFWTEDFKTLLENYIDKNPKILKDYDSHYTEKDVKFILTFHSSDIVDNMLKYDADKKTTNFEIEFKMHSTRPLNTSNMHLYTADGSVKKYNSPEEILKEFFNVRLQLYTKRKMNKIDKLSNELRYINARIKFIEDIIDGSLKIMNVPKQNVIDYLETNEFPLHDKSYDYLIRMPIHNLTYEKKEELKQESENKLNVLEFIKAQSEHDAWINDLEALEKKLI